MELTQEQKVAILKERVFPVDVEAFGRFFFPKHLNKTTPRFHKEVFGLFQSGSERIVVGAPRGHAKSTITDLVYLAWAITHGVYRFVILASDTYSQSVLFLEALKAEFESNEKLRAFYGNLVTDKWSEGEAVIGQTMVKAIGAGMKVRGLKFHESRPDLIIGDDLENDELVESQDRRDKMERWWNGAVIPSLADGGRVIVIGTVLHFDSLLAKMLDAERYTEYTKRTYAAVMDGKALWPEHQSLDDTERIKAEYAQKGLLDQFYREYMNKVISSENQKFKLEMIKYYTDNEIDRKELNNYITIDRAYSTDKVSDGTGIIVNSVDRENHWYIRVAQWFKGDEFELINLLFDLHKFWKPERMGMEQLAYDSTLRPYLEAEMRKRNYFLVIEPLKHEQRSKEKRIEGLIPRFVSSSIHLKRDQTELVDQLTQFPRGRHDDLPDALAYQLDIAEPLINNQKTKKPHVKITKFG